MSSAKSGPVFQALSAAMSSGPAQHKGDAFYRPRQQDYFSPADKGIWASTTTESPTAAYSGLPINPKVIRLISWNIDVLVGFAEERMIAALEYLERLVSSTPADIPIVVFLQEMGLSDLDQIRTSNWIRQRFNTTDLDGKNWLSPFYGTTTLIDRRLKISNVFRVPWLSKFDRDGLFVDISLSHPSSSNSEPHSDGKVLRLCNTHLESLVADPPVRPAQISAAAKYLQQPNVASALLAGDLNAIQPFDRTLHSENHLKDTYLELGGAEDSDAGYTWGYQVPQWMKDKFGCSRMDKIFFRGDVQPKAFERIGAGVKVAEEHREKVRGAGEEEWVTDHYGVMGDFELSGAWVLQGYGGGVEAATSKLS
ncbi:Nn.00g013640.m01.CDS01 [Neocucurbitaria sp. VM-36]